MTIKQFCDNISSHFLFGERPQPMQFAFGPFFGPQGLGAGGSRGGSFYRFTLKAVMCCSRLFVVLRALLEAQGAASKQLPVSLSRCPFGSREMAIEGTPRSVGLLLRVYVQDDPRNLAPVCTLVICIQHSDIGDGVLLIVCGERWPGGRKIGDIGIEWRGLHWTSRGVDWRNLLG